MGRGGGRRGKGCDASPARFNLKAHRAADSTTAEGGGAERGAVAEVSESSSRTWIAAGRGSSSSVLASVIGSELVPWLRRGSTCPMEGCPGVKLLPDVVPLGVREPFGQRCPPCWCTLGEQQGDWPMLLKPRGLALTGEGTVELDVRCELRRSEAGQKKEGASARSEERACDGASAFGSAVIIAAVRAAAARLEAIGSGQGVASSESSHRR